ncbi:MAG: hypothetical protein QOK30_2090 [Nocardioidaceae bacterium]|nr:hypothetical protein [Nocardioidaceae bacterium]
MSGRRLPGDGAVPVAGHPPSGMVLGQVGADAQSVNVVAGREAGVGSSLDVVEVLDTRLTDRQPAPSVPARNGMREGGARCVARRVGDHRGAGHRVAQQPSQSRVTARNDPLRCARRDRAVAIEPSGPGIQPEQTRQRDHDGDRHGPRGCRCVLRRLAVVVSIRGRRSQCWFGEAQHDVDEVVASQLVEAVGSPGTACPSGDVVAAGGRTHRIVRGEHRPEESQPVVEPLEIHAPLGDGSGSCVLGVVVGLTDPRPGRGYRPAGRLFDGIGGDRLVDRDAGSVGQLAGGLRDH